MPGARDLPAPRRPRARRRSRRAVYDDDAATALRFAPARTRAARRRHARAILLVARGCVLRGHVHLRARRCARAGRVCTSYARGVSPCTLPLLSTVAEQDARW